MAKKMLDAFSKPYFHNGRLTLKVKRADLNDGKPFYVYGSNEKELEANLRKRIEELREKKRLDSQVRSLKEEMDYWLEHAKKGKIQGSSVDRLEDTVHCSIFPRIPNVKISDFTFEHGDHVIRSLHSEGYAWSTIKKAADALKAFFDWEIDRGKLGKNPMRGVVVPTDNRPPIGSFPTFSAEEIDKIVATAMKTDSTGKPVYEYGAAYVLIIYTGLREGEVLGLKWSCVDFEKKMVCIKEVLSEIKDRSPQGNKKRVLSHKETPKNKSSIRWVPLPDMALKALEILKKNSWQYGRYVVCSRNGDPVWPSNFSRSFHNIEKNAGVLHVPKRGIHALRHFYANTMYEKSKDPKLVSDLLGHSSIKITMDNYVTTEKKIRAEAISERTLQIMNNL